MPPRCARLAAVAVAAAARAAAAPLTAASYPVDDDEEEEGSCRGAACAVGAPARAPAPDWRRGAAELAMLRATGRAGPDLAEEVPVRGAGGEEVCRLPRRLWQIIEEDLERHCGRRVDASVLNEMGGGDWVRLDSRMDVKYRAQQLRASRRYGDDRPSETDGAAEFMQSVHRVLDGLGALPPTALVVNRRYIPLRPVPAGEWVSGRCDEALRWHGAWTGFSDRHGWSGTRYDAKPADWDDAEDGAWVPAWEPPSNQPPTFSAASLHGCFEDILVPWHGNMLEAIVGDGPTRTERLNRLKRKGRVPPAALGDSRSEDPAVRIDPVTHPIPWDDKDPSFVFRGDCSDINTARQCPSGAPNLLSQQMRAVNIARKAAKAWGGGVVVSAAKREARDGTGGPAVDAMLMCPHGTCKRGRSRSCAPLSGATGGMYDLYPDPKTINIPIEEVAAARYILDVGGNKPADGTLSKLLLNSTVLLSSTMHDLFHRFLEPWVHYVPFAPNASDLEQVMKDLVEDEALARRIARAGREQALRFDRGMRDCYTLRLLQRYVECVSWDGLDTVFKTGDHIRYRNKGQEWRTGVVGQLVDGRPKMRGEGCTASRCVTFFDEVELLKVPPETAQHKTTTVSQPDVPGVTNKGPWLGHPLPEPQ